MPTPAFSEETLATLINPLSYADYKRLVNEPVGDASVACSVSPSGIIETEVLTQAEEGVVLTEEVIKAAVSVQKDLTWLVIVETWCNDSLQNLPVIAKVASLNKRIKLVVILRDQNEKVMDAYLTNGGRSIPKLVCFNNMNQRELATWGPRPAAIQSDALKFKAENPGIIHSAFVSYINKLYSADKGAGIQSELAALLRSCAN